MSYRPTPARLARGRDPSTGRFVSATALIPFRGRMVRARPVAAPRRDPATGQFIPRVGRPRVILPRRHPRTGRFITQAQDDLIRKARVTQADLRHILQVSPKMRRVIDFVPAERRQTVRRRMIRGLRTYRLEARQALRAKRRGR